MKKTYIIPEALIVVLNAKANILQSSPLNVSDGSTYSLGNGDTAPSGADAEVKGSKNVWDEEW